MCSSWGGRWPAQSHQPRGHVHPFEPAGVWHLGVPKPHSHWHESPQSVWLPESSSPGFGPLPPSGHPMDLSPSTGAGLAASKRVGGPCWKGKGSVAEMEALLVAGPDAGTGASRAAHCLGRRAHRHCGYQCRTRGCVLCLSSALYSLTGASALLFIHSREPEQVNLPPSQLPYQIRSPPPGSSEMF